MKQCVISILLSLFLFGFTPSSDFSPEKTLSFLDNSTQAIWKIHRLDQHRNGTGFFIGPNHFITSLHIINVLLHESSFEDMSQDYWLEDQNIVLEQEGNPSVLQVKRVLAVSALHNLALLETEENITNYLNLRDNMRLSKSLLSIAYPKGIFTKIRKMGDILYEDDQRYNFPANYSSLKKPEVVLYWMNRDWLWE